VADLLLVDGDPLSDPSVLWAGPEKRTAIQKDRSGRKPVMALSCSERSRKT
jgi:hypothetical protein